MGPGNLDNSYATHDPAALQWQYGVYRSDAFSAPVNYRYTRESYEGSPREDSHSAVRTEILNLVQSIQVGIRLSNLSHRES